MRSRLLLAPALLLPLLLVGCGGDDEPAEPAGSATTAPVVAATPSAERVAYAKAAEGVCTRAVAAGRAVPQPMTAAQYVTSFTATLRVGQEGLRGLRALTPPAADADALEEAFLGPVAAQVAAFEAALPQVRAAAAAPDANAALAKIADPGAGVTVNLEFIETYGMPTCAVFAGKRS